MEKYILTGGPSSGKTSILLSLEYDHKEYTIRESAEDIIRLHQSKGIEEPWLMPDFQDKILELQIQREQQAEDMGYERIFIDRGIIDGLAYYQDQGQNPSEMMRSAMETTRIRPYDGVFLIESLGSCEKNQVRRENDEKSQTLEGFQEQNYKDHGHNPIRIPPKSLDHRVRDILNHI